MKSLQFRRRILLPKASRESRLAINENKLDKGRRSRRSDVDSEVAEINAFMTSEKSGDEKPKVEKENGISSY